MGGSGGARVRPSRTPSTRTTFASSGEFAGRLLPPPINFSDIPLSGLQLTCKPQATGLQQSCKSEATQLKLAWKREAALKYYAKKIQNLFKSLLRIRELMNKSRIFLIDYKQLVKHRIGDMERSVEVESKTQIAY